MGSRRAVLRQKPPDKEAILPTGRMRGTNDLSQLAIELAAKISRAVRSSFRVRFMAHSIGGYEAESAQRRLHAPTFTNKVKADLVDRSSRKRLLNSQPSWRQDYEGLSS